MKTAPIRCLHDGVLPISKFIEHPRNPNFHPSEQIALLAEIIKSSGWRKPIVVSKLSGFIIKGHGRLDAARRAGLSECPVSYQAYASTAEEMADLVADNRLSELSELDDQMVRELLAEIRKADLSTEAAGFSAEEYKRLLGDISDENAEKSDRATNRRLGSSVRQYNIVFDDETQQAQWFAFLKELRVRYPNIPTIAGRISAFIEEATKAPA